jgi:beta-lactam-binding protein with PASTA domain
LIGRVLDGRYRVEARVARGGMATVYRALDTRLDRVVALKVMHQVFAEDDEFVARFIREAKSAARLSHPNVVAVFDQGDDAGQVFLAMEYVHGRTLRDLIRERRRLVPQEALSILQPVLAALSAAHAAGLVHRDVKPENVLLADDGRVKVADFGLARAAANRAATSTTTLIGTVAYLAPEQVTRGVADPRSDVYAAGIMLFEMLTGRPPYDGETAISVAYRHANEDVPPPSSVVPATPPQVDALVTRATARDPDQRPHDAGAFLAETVRVRRSLPALEADATSPTTLVPRTQHTLVVELPDAGAGYDRPAWHQPQSQPLAQQPPPPVEEYRRPRRRRRGWIALLVILLLAAGAGGAGWYYGIDRNTTAPRFLSLTAAQAQAKAATAHLKLVVAKSNPDDWSPTIPANQVLAQDPGPNTKLHKGATVTVRMSRGKHLSTVPSFDPTQTTLAAYQQALAAVGLTATTPTQTYDPTVPLGNVINVDPPVGTQIDYGKSVNVKVSQGPPPIPIVDYTGKTLDEANQALTAAGFKVTQTQDFSDTVASGTVISQTPNSGTGTNNQTVITLDVSKGQQKFKVPDETGKKVSDATKALENAGFTVKVSRLDGGPGRVLQESPTGQQPKGTVITLYVF